MKVGAKKKVFGEDIDNSISYKVQKFIEGELAVMNITDDDLVKAVDQQVSEVEDALNKRGILIVNTERAEVHDIIYVTDFEQLLKLMKLEGISVIFVRKVGVNAREVSATSEAVRKAAETYNLYVKQALLGKKWYSASYMVVYNNALLVYNLNGDERNLYKLYDDFNKTLFEDKSLWE